MVFSALQRVSLGVETNFATLLETSRDGFLQTFKQVSKAVSYDKRPKVKRDAQLKADFFPRKTLLSVGRLSSFPAFVIRYSFSCSNIDKLHGRFVPSKI